MRYGLAFLLLVASCADSDSTGALHVAVCSNCACEAYCVALCEQVGDACDGDIDQHECARSCVQWEPELCLTSTVEERACEQLELEANCYEMGRTWAPFECFDQDTITASPCDMQAAAVSRRATTGSAEFGAGGPAG